MSTITMRGQRPNYTISISELKKPEELTNTEKQVLTHTFYVLREKRTDKAINVAYTIDGLKWTANKSGKSLYYNDAIFKIINGKISLVGDFKVSPFTYVERFYPRKFRSPFLNMCESTWINKAIQMI